MIKGSEILEVLHQTPEVIVKMLLFAIKKHQNIFYLLFHQNILQVRHYLFSLYNCQYSDFFTALGKLEQVQFQENRTDWIYVHMNNVHDMRSAYTSVGIVLMRCYSLSRLWRQIATWRPIMPTMSGRSRSSPVDFNFSFVVFLYFSNCYLFRWKLMPSCLSHTGPSLLPTWQVGNSQLGLCIS